jgi:hypothetical protein
MRAVFVAIALVAAVSGASANQGDLMLLQMNESRRNTQLSRFMAASGESCNVVDSMRQGAGPKGQAFWSMRCSNGRAYQLMIENDAEGSTRIVDCQVLARVKSTPCFTKF